MNKKRIRKEAEERISIGYTRQHVFEELMLEYPEEKPKAIADLVRFVPSIAAREHYKVYQHGLMAVIVGYAAL